MTTTPPTPPALVFTDLDGTLLDHETYRWDAARPMLARLRARGIPVILASSKTAAEMAPLRAAMALGPVPMICENGAGVVSAGGAEVQGDPPQYARLRAALDRVAPALRRQFEGFADMGVAGVAAATGLPVAGAARAARRDFTEPGIWHGTPEALTAFIAELEGHGIAARRGGRFLTLGLGGTKADRMAAIAADYGHPPTIALGDAPNDVEMIEAADRGAVIANPGAAPLPPLRGEPEGRVIRSDAPGPEGWTACLASILSELDRREEG